MNVWWSYGVFDVTLMERGLLTNQDGAWKQWKSIAKIPFLHTVSLFEQRGTRKKPERCSASPPVCGESSQRIVCNLSCQNAGKCISRTLFIFFKFSGVLDCSAVQIFTNLPPAIWGQWNLLWSTNGAGITGSAGQWNKKLRSNPANHQQVPYSASNEFEWDCLEN